MQTCQRSECQTTAGCAHRGPLGEYCWFEKLQQQAGINAEQADKIIALLEDIAANSRELLMIEQAKWRR
jgi:hypothetical protein